MSSEKNFIPNVADGDVFEVAGIQFIKFPGIDGKVPAVAKDILFRSFFGKNNDLRQSNVLGMLRADVLPKIIAEVGEDGLCDFQTDLTTLDGLKPYGLMDSKISLPTLDFYRQHVDVFDRYNPGRWWWLATPESAMPHCSPDWVLCVSPSGSIGFGGYNSGGGVRPFLIFNSSIFESSGM